METMEPKKRKKWKYIIIGVCLFVVSPLLGIFSGGVLSPVPFLYLGSFEGKVVDAETKEPISGAAVLAVYYKSGPSPGGSITIAVDAQETLTDDKGEFRIPRALRWFSLRRGLTEDRIVIFKPGYGAFPHHARSRAVDVKGHEKGYQDGLSYELPKLETEEERKDNLFFNYYLGRTRTFISVINQERKSLGLPTIAFPSQEGKQ